MPDPQPFIVGRQSEVERYAMLAHNHTPYWLLNVYGPGGIGKTVVGQKMCAYARQQAIPFAFVDGARPDLTPELILYLIKEGLAANGVPATLFDNFERQYQEYSVIQAILHHSGGIHMLFDVVGSVRDPLAFAKLMDDTYPSATEQTRHKLSNRFALERYLRGVEQSLGDGLFTSLGTAVAVSVQPLTLIFDTYEEMEGLDDWVCRTLTRMLPEGIKIVVLGRNALPKVNFDWSEYDTALEVMELPELPEHEAKAFLAHHGLRDAAALTEVYRFTGGYPLLLVLVVHLAREAGGWNRIGAMESLADRDRVATELLNRILREEQAREVRAFLEKGVVARWFTPETVSVILQAGAEEGRAIYDKLRRHSFVERHPRGLKFHDKIRELLLARLKLNQAEYNRIVRLLTDYYAQKAGIKQVEPENTQSNEPTTPKYSIHIYNSSNIVIGDDPEVTQTSDGTQTGTG